MRYAKKFYRNWVLKKIVLRFDRSMSQTYTRPMRKKMFFSVFGHARLPDVEYLVKLEALESEVRDDEMADATLDLLRDKAPKNRGSFRDSVTDNFRVIKPKDFRVLT